MRRPIERITIKLGGYKLVVKTFVNDKPQYKHSNYYDTIEELLADVAKNQKFIVGKNIKIIYVP